MITAFDQLLVSCVQLGDKIPMLRHLANALAETTPVVHYWPGWDTQLIGDDLPNEPIIWPDQYFSLCTSSPMFGMTYHQFCVANGVVDLQDLAWLDGRPVWQPAGILVFAKDPDNFDAVLYARPVGRGNDLLFPEMQLRFARNPEQGWTWYRARTGPVNHYFYKPLVKISDGVNWEQLDANVNHMGRQIQRILAAYRRHIAQPGEWKKFPPKPPRMKMKDGKPKKIYEIAHVGHTVFVPTKEQHENIHTEGNSAAT